MSPSAKAALSITWTWPTMVLLLILGMTPLVAPMMPQIDGHLFPVTSKVQFVNVKEVEGGLTVQMQYEKLRDCEYLGTTLTSSDGLPIPFAPAAVNASQPDTKATGQQLSRRWLVGASSLEGVRLRWVHRCQPFWITITDAYP